MRRFSLHFLSMTSARCITHSTRRTRLNSPTSPMCGYASTSPRPTSSVSARVTVAPRPSSPAFPVSACGRFRCTSSAIRTSTRRAPRPSMHFRAHLAAGWKTCWNTDLAGGERCFSCKIGASDGCKMRIEKGAAIPKKPARPPRGRMGGLGSRRYRLKSEAVACDEPVLERAGGTSRRER